MHASRAVTIFGFMVFPKGYTDPSDDELTATRALYDGVPLASKFVWLIERRGLRSIVAIERVTDHRANTVRADHELGLDSSAVGESQEDAVATLLYVRQAVLR
jgi:hypothetical protein